MLKALLNMLGFQCGWVLCVFGSAHGYPWLGPAVAVILLAGHSLLVEQPLRSIQFIAMIGLVGTVVDSLLGLIGVLRFHNSLGPGWLCPPWLGALWMLLATTPDVSLRWLRGRMTLAAVLGAIAGPSSYYAGAEVGALALGTSLLTSLIVLAVVWAAVLPLMVATSARLDHSTVPVER